MLLHINGNIVLYTSPVKLCADEPGLKRVKKRKGLCINCNFWSPLTLRLNDFTLRVSY